MLIRLVLSSTVAFSALFAQVVQPDRRGLPSIRCEVIAVDEHGTPIDDFEVRVDGQVRSRDLRGIVEMKTGSRKIQISAKGFSSTTRDVEVDENTTRLIFCLPLGLLWDRSLNPADIELRGKQDSVAACRDLYVFPLHCALSRQPTFHRLFAGRVHIGDLPAGTYLFTVLDGKRTCVTTSVDVPQGAGTPIVIVLP
jgi:hypothetical protein